jgi:predicted MFS family arabinose efflux permease
MKHQGDATSLLGRSTPRGRTIRFSRTAAGLGTTVAAEKAARDTSASAWANPQFRLLFIGNVTTMLGFGMMQVVQGVLSFELTGKNSSVGLVAMGWGLPMLFLGPVGGALSDRLSKRMLLMFGQAGVGAIFFTIGLLFLLDVLNIWMLFGMTTLMGFTFAALMPARQAWVGDLLQGPALANGVALQQLMMNATRIVGPLAAGGMIAWAAVGIGGTYLAMSSLFVMALGLLFFMQPTQRRRGANNASVFGDVKVGLRYTWNAKEVRLMMLMFAGVVMTAFSYQQLMPGFLENELGQPTNRVGWMFGASAVGGIILTLALTANAGRANVSKLMFACGAASGVSVILVALAPNFELALGGAVLVGASSSGFQMCNQINLMQKTDPAFFGRVMSLTMTAFGLQMAVGFPAGVIADIAGERYTMAGLAAGCICVVAIGWVASRSMRREGALSAAA